MRQFMHYLYLRDLRRADTMSVTALLVIAVFCGVVAYAGYAEKRALLTKGIETEATILWRDIVKKRERSSSTGTVRTVYEPTLRYRYVTPDGPIVQTREVSRAYYDAVRDQRRIPVHYLPERPAKHYVDPASLGETQFWAGLLAVLFAGMAAGYGRIRKAQLRKVATA